jgi:hypothetical protein
MIFLSGQLVWNAVRALNSFILFFCTNRKSLLLVRMIATGDATECSRELWGGLILQSFVYIYCRIAELKRWFDLSEVFIKSRSQGVRSCPGWTVMLVFIDRARFYVPYRSRRALECVPLREIPDLFDYLDERISWSGRTRLLENISISSQ